MLGGFVSYYRILLFDDYGSPTVLVFYCAILDATESFVELG